MYFHCLHKVFINLALNNKPFSIKQSSLNKCLPLSSVWPAYDVVHLLFLMAIWLWSTGGPLVTTVGTQPSQLSQPSPIECPAESRHWEADGTGRDSWLQTQTNDSVNNLQ